MVGSIVSSVFQSRSVFPVVFMVEGAALELHCALVQREEEGKRGNQFTVTLNWKKKKILPIKGPHKIYPVQYLLRTCLYISTRTYCTSIPEEHASSIDDVGNYARALVSRTSCLKMRKQHHHENFLALRT